ncbi:dethiobiotin synthase [Mycobacterium sp. MS1601]|uniref:dethiobiotin synthase n=1 Tax=Mycobacterium sp. MS1601 TaxID=1936029 RepID=UPI0009792C94|nr:dethiobiotin synthase [Mycobacterium sp. MS1601]AQA05586.1 dethiobiotin synthase [Mycobacterium sp. MS1601]
MSVVVITGTGTGVGKTVATAALACHARLANMAVAVCKPVQTGTETGDDDLAEIGRLSGVSVLSGVARYPQPLAPVAAAAQAGLPLPTAEDLVNAIRAADAPGQLTLVEGAGGLLVQIAAAGITVADLAVELGAPVVVVVSAVLGTLNYTALTLEAMANRGLDCAGLIIGSWPAAPGAAEISNRGALAELGAVRAALPAGAGSLSAQDFTTLCVPAFDTAWVAGLVE